MDRETQLAYLAATERAVAEYARRIAQQERLLAELNPDGQDTKVAAAVLATLRPVQAEQVATRATFFSKHYTIVARIPKSGVWIGWNKTA